MSRVTRHQLLGEIQSPITEVLMVCSCGVVKTITLEGHWDISQMQPEAALDKEYLRRMGIRE